LPDHHSVRAGRLLAAALLALPVLAHATPASADTPDLRPFVYETLPPTPKADPVETWRTNRNAIGPSLPCGTYAVAFRVAVPPAVDGRFVVNLRHNVRPWGGGFAPYSLVVRTDSAIGPVAYEGPMPSGNVFVDLTDSLAPAHLAQGWVDLWPTVLCSHPWEGWSWHPDTDWGYWDVEAYHVTGRQGRLAGVHSVATYYRYGFRRLDDLAKYDLVILAETYPWFADELATLRAAGTTVAGYVSFTLEERCSPFDPLIGDGTGPGGFDSRYVDFLDTTGAKVADGFPDYEGGTETCRSYRTDPRSRSWRDRLVSEARRQVANGATAVFLDGFEPLHPDLVPGMRQALLDLRAALPSVPIVANGYAGFPVAGDLVDAVMLESFTYSYGGVRIDPALDWIRDDVARDANFVRGYPGVLPGSAAPSFELLSMDTIEPYDASEKVAEAIERADANGMTFGAWDLVMANPVNDLVATRTGTDGTVELAWTVADGAEEMSSVGRYEVRRAATPIATDADWDAATPVATTLPAGTAAFTDPAAPESAHYAMRGYRTGDAGLELYGTAAASAPPLSDVPSASADLSVTQTFSPGPATTGDVLELRLSVANAGPDQATAVTVVETLPAGMTFVSGTPGCAAAGAKVTCVVGALASGGTAALTVVVQPSVGGTMTAAAVADGAEADPDPSDDTASVAVPVLRCTKVGTAGNDTINGTANADVLCGLSGNDSLVGAAGNDILVGGPGADRLRGSKGNDTLFGGAGVDTGSWSGDGVASGVTVDLAAGTATNAQLGTDTIVLVDGISTVENAEGSSYPDRLVGDEWPNVLNGAGGNDVLLPGAGADQVAGGGGVDTVSFENAAAGAVVDLVARTARIGADTDTLTAIRNAIGTTFADTFVGDGMANVFTGLAGNDVMTGAAANDKLYGGDGDDTLDGGAGSDVVDGGLGVDVCRLGESRTGCEA
jgi:uncharacterized repeat protein (TIGR01451 family)